MVEHEISVHGDAESVHGDVEMETMSPYELAERYALYTNQSLFISGRAGTGKTTFLHKLQKQTNKYLVVAAPTGVAAINAGGMTIHSLFQLPLEIIIPTPASYYQLFSTHKISKQKMAILQNMETLVIDEISMVRADILDAVDVVLRQYKNRKDVPFGGVQVIMIGDLFQLSPVVKKGEEECLLNKYYNGPYFFYSHILNEIKPVFIEFDHIFRQTDATFIHLLNEVRENNVSEKGKKMLRLRYLPSFENSDDDFHIMLTTHNSIADRVNKEHLDMLQSEERVFNAVVQGDFPVNCYPTDACLTLKIGARVMFIRNDDAFVRRYYNGKTGIVVDIKDEVIVVQCDDGIIDVSPLEWKNERYVEDTETKTVKKEVIGIFTQIPLRLAWAITIHKSQGLTFDKVMIDAELAFAYGQIYVALSRCRTLNGIILSSPLDDTFYGNDPSVIHYMQQQPTLEIAKNNLRTAEDNYKKNILLSIFDFGNLASFIDDMIPEIQKVKSFNESTIPFLENLKNEITEIITVSVKFQKQIATILQNQNDTFLKTRLQKAGSYFIPLLQNLDSKIKASPVKSKNKKHALVILNLLNDLHRRILQNICFITLVAHNWTVKAYIQAKTTFHCPPLSLTIYEMNKKNEKGTTQKITLELYLSGLSVEDIAKQRGVTISTIYSHFIYLIKNGMIHIDDVMPANLLKRIKDVLDENPDVKSISEARSLLNDEVDYGPIRLVMSCLSPQ